MIVTYRRLVLNTQNDYNYREHTGLVVNSTTNYPIIISGVLAQQSMLAVRHRTS